MAENFYQNVASRSGVFAGRTLIQAKGEIGGNRSVFVKLVKSGKGGLVYPTHGGLLVNPFKGHAKIFAGDLFEYTPSIAGNGGSTVKILKTYEVAAAATASTEISLVRDGYHHIPFVGDTIMVAPATINGTGLGVTITAVTKATANDADVYNVTVSSALTVAKGDVIVEAAEAGATVHAMVTKPNAYAPCDYDMIFDPPASADEFDAVRYMVTPCLANPDTILKASAMSPLPDSIKAMNKSLVDGWFVLY